MGVTCGKKSVGEFRDWGSEFGSVTGYQEEIPGEIRKSNIDDLREKIGGLGVFRDGNRGGRSQHLAGYPGEQGETERAVSKLSRPLWFLG